MKVLVTGGAGFIGSNIVDALLNDDRIKLVRVLDNLSTGFKSNLSEFIDNPKFDFLEGDIRNMNTCIEATKGIDFVSHQAALGSVPRSLKDPLTTNNVNITGTLNMFQSCIKNNVKRIIFAASSSTYGDNTSLPKIEENIGNPLSPYAVTKYVNELYARVFSTNYSFEFIGLRYFNVFGPKQDPNGAYAAVIPLFFKHAIEGKPPTINGDGSFSRDFTFVDNAVEANLKSIFVSDHKAINQIYNIAYGERISLNELWSLIKNIAHIDLAATYGPERQGDVPHSLADISKAKLLLQYNPSFNTEQGLKQTYDWYSKN